MVSVFCNACGDEIKPKLFKDGGVRFDVHVARPKGERPVRVDLCSECYEAWLGWLKSRQQSE